MLKINKDGEITNAQPTEAQDMDTQGYTGYNIKAMQFAYG